MNPFFLNLMVQGGSGYVRGVRFENVRMEDVSNPIIIDQFYCDSPKPCPNQVHYPVPFIIEAWSLNSVKVVND